MITKLRVDNNDLLISDAVIYANPRQELTEVVNELLSGSWHIQTVGNPRHLYNIEFIITADRREEVDEYAALKTPLRLERHGQDYIGVIRGNPDWEQEIGSTDAGMTKKRCSIVLLITGGD